MTKNRQEQQTPRLLVIATLLALVLAMMAVSFMVVSGDDPLVIRTKTVVIVLLGVVYVLVTALFIVRYLRVRQLDLRIALTGRPAAGKTVFANLSYDLLMNTREPGYGFTADSKSAIAVYQAIRGLSENSWPTRTTARSVVSYRGRAKFGRRLEVDLEIGDSAGEHWIDLSHNESHSESDYLQYVISADAIAHVVSAEELIDEDPPLALGEDLQDLRVTSQLMRSTRRSSGQLGPLLIIITKMDLVPGWQPDDYLLRPLAPVDALDQVRSILPRKSAALLAQFADSLTKDFASVHMMLSSHLAAVGGGSLFTYESPELLDWIRDAAIGGHGQRPTLVETLTRAMRG